MPKMKTNKAAAKRYKATGSGKIVRNKAGRRHKLGHKTAKRKRNMRRSAVLTTADEKVARQLIPYK
ncbi:MAG: 50S ribosomal protein L35 [Bacillota bacterium]|jgi:large subunit ribosomal protein L35|nr:50S ribosomal protein L35 [Bacillota bacterium]NLH87832.1 50S ribosomal protein L35 [Bacillota bacterium]